MAKKPPTTSGAGDPAPKPCTERNRKAGERPPGTLLAGGNPRIPKGYGEEPVRAYIAAMPGWKRDVGRKLDELITRAVPGVCKGVKWNSAMYGDPGQEGTWFLSFHCFDRYVKVAFFLGARLDPLPPGPSKQADVRYLDVHAADLATLDERKFISWVKQAAQLPGTRM